MSNEEKILKELKKISRIITMSNGKTLETELENYANTKERKITWVLIDGKRKTDEIAKIVGQTKRSVDLFLDILEYAELIDERKYGVPPIRKLDLIPSTWISLIPKQTNDNTSKSKSYEFQTEDGNDASK
ncbi:MAG: hypothetical protein WD717_06545 [Nitrosarchaeum sp.]